MSSAPYTLYPGVVIDLVAAQIGAFVLIGVPPRGAAPGELATRIGARATIRSHSVIYAGNAIGDDFETGHGVLVRESSCIGDAVSIGSHSVLEHHVEVGNRVRLHSNVFVPEYSILEEGCGIGPGTVLTNTRYPWSAGAKESMQGARIGVDAILGANVTVLPGVRVGRGALVGAGAVVVSDVPEGVVVVGNPARIVRAVSEIEEYRGRLR